MAEKTDLEKMGDRQDGKYKAPILSEPTAKAPVPKWVPESSR